MNVIGKATLNWEKYTEYVQRETINVKKHPEDSWYLDIRYKVPHEVESIVWSCMRKIGEFKNGPIAIPKEEIVEEIKKHQQYLTSMNLYWDLMFYNSDAAEIRSGELETIVHCSAQIMISGYDTPLYNDYLHTWDTLRIPNQTTSGVIREEIVWMNYTHQLSLYDFGIL